MVDTDRRPGTTKPECAALRPAGASLTAQRRACYSATPALARRPVESHPRVPSNLVFALRPQPTPYAVHHTHDTQFGQIWSRAVSYFLRLIPIDISRYTRRGTAFLTAPSRRFARDLMARPRPAWYPALFLVAPPRPVPISPPANARPHRLLAGSPWASPGQPEPFSTPTLEA